LFEEKPEVVEEEEEEEEKEKEEEEEEEEEEKEEEESTSCRHSINLRKENAEESWSQSKASRIKSW
jgi:hypothetical protein